MTTAETIKRINDGWIGCFFEAARSPNLERMTCSQENWSINFDFKDESRLYIDIKNGHIFAFIGAGAK